MADKDKEKKVPVQMTEEDWQKLLAYAKAAAPDEIIGLAHAEIQNRKIIVSNPIILPQEVTGATCEVVKEDFVKFIGEYEHIDKILCVWHSHVNMSAFFSSCDRDTSNTLAMLGTMVQAATSWFVSIVINVKGEYEAKVDMYHPLAASLSADIEIPQRHDPMYEEIKEEVKRMLKKKSWSTTSAEKEYRHGGAYPFGSGGIYHQKEIGEKETGVLIVGGRGPANEKKDEENGKDGKPWNDDSIFSEFPVE